MKTPSQMDSDVDKTVQQIMKIVDQINDSKILKLDGDTLSALAFKLSSLKVYLGEHVALARFERDNAEGSYILMREESYKKHRDRGETQGDSDSAKRIESSDMLAKVHLLNYQYEVIKNLYMDCHDLIESIRSRLIHLQTERGESRHE